MSRAPKRLSSVPSRSVVLVLLALVARGVSGATAAPVTTTAQKPVTTPPPGTTGTLSRPTPPAGESRVSPELVSPAAAERLRKAGLDPKDPAFGAKLRALAKSTSAAYVRGHVLKVTAAPAGGSGGTHRSIPSGPATAPNSRLIAASLPVQGNVIGAYDDTASDLGANPQISTTHGKKYPGRYFFLVKTSRKVATQGGPMFSMGSTTLSYGCSAKTGFILTRAAAADDPNFTYGLQKYPPSNGAYYYYVDAEFYGLPIGQPRAAQMTFSFENAVTAPLQVTLEPDMGTATVSITIDHVPEVTGMGYVYPWGWTNLSSSNAKLGAPTTARVGGGNWQTQTAGDDLVGVGVGLGQGWKIVSTTVKSAVSALSPQDLTPDNTWRGASITTPPSGSDLRTAVHWHYSGIDSLDYTLEWNLAGPMGQRPILTLNKAGDCDQ